MQGWKPRRRKGSRSGTRETLILVGLLAVALPSLGLLAGCNSGFQPSSAGNSRTNDFPAWSPNGRKIAFMRGRWGSCGGPSSGLCYPARDDIYVMNADGSQLHRLRRMRHESYDAPAWSPDGKRIAFSSGDPSRIYVMNSDGSQSRQLTPDSADDGQPAWSPDGRKIAFMRRSNGVGRIYVMNADGSNQHQVTRYSDFDSAPAWSPDGRLIALTVLIKNTPQLAVMNADGTNLHRLTRDLSHDYDSPAWSPDGREIAFVYSGLTSGTCPVYVVDADGRNLRSLARPSTDAERCSAPAWSPDGERIAFSTPGDSDPTDVDQIYVMNADGGNQHPLTH